MDKYTKLKIELDKQKQYGLQLSTNLRQAQAQKKKNRIMSSYRTVGGNSTSLSFSPSSMYRVTHFSHFFPRSTVKKKIKVQIEDNNNDIKRLKDELENCKKDFEKKENGYISQINIINKELEKMKIKNENNEEKIKELKRKKNIEIEKEKNEKQKILNEEKEKNKKEIDKINNELNKLKEENILIKNDNKNINDIKNELEEYKKKEKDNEIIINELKMENERLKKNSALNFKLIKEENDELLKDIQKLNETINLMKKKEKEIKEKEEKEKEEKEKEEKIKKLKEEKEKEENKKNKIKNNNFKVMRIYSNTFIYRNINPEISFKLKDLEKKYNELKKEKNKSNEDNKINDIIHLKEIKTIKEKYEKEITELKNENISLNKQIIIINTKNISNKELISNNTKKMLKDLTENFSNNIANIQKKYENRIIAMKQKIKKIKHILIKYINKNSKKEEEDKNIIMINELKEEIYKIEKGKQKMEVQLSNYDINFKKQNNEITKLKNELKEAYKKLDKLKNEARWNDNDKSELDDMNKKLKKQLEMYIIENNGKSKVIEERNNEISKLKELLNRKQ